MKKVFTLAAMALSLAAFAQPVVQNGNNVPAPGLTAPVSIGVAAGGPGAAGADQTWDFSSLSVTSAGTLTTIDPATSAHAASFSSATHGFTLANSYSYFRVSGDKMEVMAYTISSPGSGNDYSPNPRTVLKFPFSYNETFTDTWQKANQTANTVTTTYDGYGTLKTPTKTYTNVIRLKEDYGDGADYQWYTLNPLMAVAIYDHNVNSLYLIGANAVSAEKTISHKNTAITLYPNPSQNILNIDAAMALQKFEITDALGKTILAEDIADVRNVKISLPQEMQNGIYYIKLYSAEGIINKTFVKTGN